MKDNDKFWTHEKLMAVPSLKSAINKNKLYCKCQRTGIKLQDCLAYLIDSHGSTILREIYECNEINAALRNHSQCKYCHSYKQLEKSITWLHIVMKDMEITTGRLNFPVDLKEDNRMIRSTKW